MARILITAFQPYGEWETNASWLSLVELTRNLPDLPTVTTRLLPVDYDEVAERLGHELGENYDFVVLTGQAVRASRIELEGVALNLSSSQSQSPSDRGPILPDGPLAYASDLPLDSLAAKIRSQGIPAAVSHHAGTYLCNAALYLTLHEIATRRLATRALFVHLPLEPRQVAELKDPIPSMASQTAAQALSVLLQGLHAIHGQPAGES